MQKIHDKILLENLEPAITSHTGVVPFCSLLFAGFLLEEQMNLQRIIDHGGIFVKIKQNDKIPLQSWKEAKQSNLDIVMDWINSGFNIALKTGGSFFVIDIDKKELYNSFVKEFEIPDTFRVSTPRGWHLYFQTPDFPIKSKAGILPEIDARGEGGIIVTPPSKRTINGTEHCYCSEINNQPILPASSKLLELLKPKERPKQAKKTFLDSNSKHYIKKALENEIQAVLNSQKGMRNETLHKAAFSLATIEELEEDKIKIELILAGAEIGLGKKEVLTTIRSGIKSGRLNLR